MPIDFAAAGSPTIQTYHGLSVTVNDNIVGRIQSWNPQVYARNGKHVYELNHITFGRAVDYVPSINTGYTVQMSRMEVWNQELEITFGYPVVWTDLIDQNAPFGVNEYLFKGSTPYRIWAYAGCWFDEKNPNGMEAENDATIMMNGSFKFVSRRRVL